MRIKVIEPIVKDLKIIIYLCKIAHQISKTYLITLITSAVVKAIMPFLNLIVMKLIIDELMGGKRVEVFVGLVLTVAFGNFILNVLNRLFEKLVNIKNTELLNGFDLMVGEKIMNLDFEMIEDPDILDLKERAIFPIHNQGALYRIINYAIDLLTQILTMIGLMAMISTLNPLIIVFLIIMAVISTLIQKQAQAIMFKFFQLLIPVNRKFNYFLSVTNDFNYGKDIRLYHMEELLMDRIEDYNQTSLSVFMKLYMSLGKYAGYREIMMQVQLICIYAYMAYQVVKKTIGLGDFTMYVSAATQFGQCMSRFGNIYMELSQMCRYIESYQEFDALESKGTKGTKQVEQNMTPTVEFREVSFKYPKSDAYALKDVSMTLQSGEKLSIVGLNGAGKTTFIKLLTRLYEPTEGGIYLNGVNILEYDLQEYLDLMSVVFQDFKLLAFSLKENIVFDHEVQESVVLDVLKEAGFEKDLEKLPRGIETPIYKTFEEDGIEFSGGQSQKLAIARAIYKDSPLVILDEPTSALDPIAEYDIYHRFNEMVGDKTAIYISHRLSSCLFCDRIAVFKEGRMVELGTHGVLIQEKGLYQEMYQAQAQYYV